MPKRNIQQYTEKGGEKEDTSEMTNERCLWDSIVHDGQMR